MAIKRSLLKGWHIWRWIDLNEISRWYCGRLRKELLPNRSYSKTMHFSCSTVANRLSREHQTSAHFWAQLCLLFFFMLLPSVVEFCCVLTPQSNDGSSAVFQFFKNMFRYHERQIFGPTAFRTNLHFWVVPYVEQLRFAGNWIKIWAAAFIHLVQVQIASHGVFNNAWLSKIPAKTVTLYQYVIGKEAYAKYGICRKVITTSSWESFRLCTAALFHIGGFEKKTSRPLSNFGRIYFFEYHQAYFAFSRDVQITTRRCESTNSILITCSMPYACRRMWNERQDVRCSTNFWRKFSSSAWKWRYYATNEAPFPAHRVSLLLWRI